MKQALNAADYPKTPHYQIHLEETCVEYDGYENNSRKQIVEVYTFTDETAWKEKIHMLSTAEGIYKKKFSAFKVNPVNIQIHTAVQII